jgi:sialic acid synthase SpsE
VTYQVSDTDKMRRRSLFVVEDIKEGELITEKNVRSVRPGFGLHPKYYKEILGKQAICNLERGDRLKLDHLKI